MPGTMVASPPPAARLPAAPPAVRLPAARLRLAASRSAQESNNVADYRFVVS
ncbi:MAG TPA: hypothetical protein VFB06_33470 [Streptosporangiaceae bacterium]|nr:hypothetical protein [Streptosporangiaceae bacterium]